MGYLIDRLIEKKLLTLDVEFGNSHGFFSASKTRPDLYTPGHAPASREFNASIESASLRCTDQLKTTSERAVRSVHFNFISSSSIFDVVSRYVVIDTTSNRSAVINEHSINHRSSNIYYQYPASAVRVPVGEKSWIDFRGFQEGVREDLFEHVFYIRDDKRVEAGNRWIVHHRAVATLKAQRLILRGCNPRFEGPAPRWLNTLAPAFLMHWLFRIRERRFPNFPVMVVGENLLSTGHQINLASTLHCYE